MDKHIGSVLKEMTYVYLRFIIHMMKLGIYLSILMFLLACVAMPIKIASILLISGILWCLGWMFIAKSIIRGFKLDRIEFY